MTQFIYNYMMQLSHNLFTIRKKKNKIHYFENFKKNYTSFWRISLVVVKHSWWLYLVFFSQGKKTKKYTSWQTCHPFLYKSNANRIHHGLSLTTTQYSTNNRNLKSIFEPNGLVLSFYEPFHNLLVCFE